MTREFIMLSEFDREWKEADLTDEDLLELQNFLLENPDFGNVIQGTDGVRKIRWKIPGKGKSGGIRVIYLDIFVAKKIYLLTAYQKKEKANLTNTEKSEIRKLVGFLKKLNEDKERK